MKEAILKLKKLSIAYQAALEYDYCPELGEAEEIEAMLDVDRKQIEEALIEYAGKRPDELADKIIRIIDSI